MFCRNLRSIVDLIILFCWKMLLPRGKQLSSLGTVLRNNKIISHAFKEVVYFTGITYIGQTWDGVNFPVVYTPPKITSMGIYTFEAGANYSSVIGLVPPSLTSSNNNIARYRRVTIIMLPSSPPSATSPLAYASYSILYVPDDSIQAYQSATGWSAAKEIHGLSELSGELKEYYDYYKQYV